MKTLLIKILTITLLFTACSPTSVYNLKPTESILCPITENVYIHNKPYKKDLKIIRLNGESPSFSFTGNIKVPIGETTFLIRSYFMSHMRMAKIKFNVLAGKAYYIHGKPNGNGMTFVIKSNGKVILEEEGVRKF
jgi:hypothetical protein